MRKRVILISLALLLTSATIYAKNGLDSINSVLENAIDNKELYSSVKEEKIASLKYILSFDDLSGLQQYKINKNIYEEYHKYISDSALYYTEKNLEIARTLGQENLINESLIHLALEYSVTGMYIESRAILEKINSRTLSPELLTLYYETYRLFYDHYAQSINRPEYYRMSELYRDSLLSSLDGTCILYKTTYAQKIFYLGDQKGAEALLLNVLDDLDEDNPQRSLVYYLLGMFYQGDDPDMKKKYFTYSAISDVQNAVKDNASQQALALCYYHDGNIDRAYKYMDSAINDAIFCNVRHRTSEGLAFYPIINEAYQNKEAGQKKELRIYLVLISLLSLFFVALIFYVYKQMKRLSRTRKELYRTNVKLNELNQDMLQSNNQLKDINAQLSESNHVKEEYIAHFFDLCSTYIDKLEDNRKFLHKKMLNGQMEELSKILKSTTYIESERSELYHNFDTIFLSLYPTFIDEFNALRVEEERIIPKQNEILNTELRVFALIRLGIKDSAKIAKFLGYSLSTIYNYRTKARNVAIVDRDDFENMVSKIGIYHQIEA